MFSIITTAQYLFLKYFNVYVEVIFATLVFLAHGLENRGNEVLRDRKSKVVFHSCHFQLLKNKRKCIGIFFEMKTRFTKYVLFQNCIHEYIVNFGVYVTTFLKSSQLGCDYISLGEEPTFYIAFL